MKKEKKHKTSGALYAHLSAIGRKGGQCLTPAKEAGLIKARKALAKKWRNHGTK